MLFQLLYLYLSFISASCMVQILLILFDISWLEYPPFYLSAVRWIQDLFPQNYPPSVEQPWPSIIQKSKTSELRRSANSHLNYEIDDNDKFGLGLVQAGLEAIVQDQLSTAFDHTPSYSESLMRNVPLQQWSPTQKALFYVTLCFRLFFLLPIRFIMMTSSFLFLILACMASFCIDLTFDNRIWISVVYCKIFNSALGVYAEYENEQFRPQKPGIAVSNHITPNDIQLIFGGVPRNSDHGYVVTGQKHIGLIGVIETLTGRICPSLWVERKDAKDRNQFLQYVLRKAQDDGPVLLFPEGYCTNNTQVLQFRKAAFEDNTFIYPIAIRQDGRYGDAYWFEDRFPMYLLRVMCSWATVYRITYIERMTRIDGESNTDFAYRVQSKVASVAGVPPTPFDGGLWYKEAERRRLRESLEKKLATKFLGSTKLMESC